MSDDDSLLAGIVAAPGDRLRMLVYADFLDERDDPRGELVRLEDRLIDLPPASDEFWELKSRRNQLRATAPPDWLAAMRYGVEVHPVFTHGWPDGWRGRWRVIREFAERWYSVALPDVGGRRGEIAEAKESDSHTLPESVREHIALMQDMATGGQEPAYGCRELIGSTRGCRVATVMLFRAGDLAFVVNVRDLSSSTDPPVYSYFYGSDPPDSRYKFEDDSVSNFVMLFLFSQSQNTYHQAVEPDRTAQVPGDLGWTFAPSARIENWTITEVAGASLISYAARHGTVGHEFGLRLTDLIPGDLHIFMTDATRGYTMWQRAINGLKCPCSYCVDKMTRTTRP